MDKKTRLIWFALLGILSSVTLWHSSSAAIQLYQYFILSQNTTAQPSQWSVKKESDNKYSIETEYSFSSMQKEYRGKSPPNTKHYPNPWTAQSAVENLSKQNWTVWYRPSDPTQSSLIRPFPYKSCVYAATLLGIVLYFLLLRWHVSRKLE